MLVFFLFEKGEVLNPDGPAHPSVHFDYVIVAFSILVNRRDRALASQNLMVNPKGFEQPGGAHVNPVPYCWVSHPSSPIGKGNC